MDPWGQPTFVRKPDADGEPWSMRSSFLALIPVVIAIAFLIGAFDHR